MNAAQLNKHHCNARPIAYPFFIAIAAIASVWGVGGRLPGIDCLV